MGNIAEGVSTIPDGFLDQYPSILEIIKYVSTAKWNQIGVQLELNDVALAGCSDCTEMFQLWIFEKVENATRKKLISALRPIGQNSVALCYESYLNAISMRT